MPTLSDFGPEGDVGLRVDWTAYDADPVPRHRLEMLDLRDVERDLLTRLREHTSGSTRSAANRGATRHAPRPQADLDTGLWGMPRPTPGRALRIMSLAGTPLPARAPQRRA